MSCRIHRSLPALHVSSVDEGAVMVPPNAVRDFHVWKKQADGSWKVAVDIWNSGLPAGG